MRHVVAGRGLPRCALGMGTQFGPADWLPRIGQSLQVRCAIESRENIEPCR